MEETPVRDERREKISPVDRTYIARHGLSALSTSLGDEFNTGAKVLEDTRPSEDLGKIREERSVELVGPDGKRKLYVVRHRIVQSVQLVSGGNISCRTVGRVGISLDNLGANIPKSVWGTLEWAEFDLTEVTSSRGAQVDATGQTVFSTSREEPNEMSGRTRVENKRDLSRLKSLTIAPYFGGDTLHLV